MHHFGDLRRWMIVSGWTLIAMVVLPAIFRGVLQFFPLDSEQLQASVLDAAMPMGLTPYALSVQYKLKTTLVARIVVLGTLLSMLIIPFWLVILS
jgi:predicted permease